MVIKSATRLASCSSSRSCLLFYWARSKADEDSALRRRRRPELALTAAQSHNGKICSCHKRGPRPKDGRPKRQRAILPLFPVSLRRCPVSARGDSRQGRLTTREKTTESVLSSRSDGPSSLRYPRVRCPKNASPRARRQKVRRNRNGISCVFGKLAAWLLGPCVRVGFRGSAPAGAEKAT